jgi:hypothetical protein
METSVIDFEIPDELVELRDRVEDHVEAGPGPALRILSLHRRAVETAAEVAVDDVAGEGAEAVAHREPDIAPVAREAEEGALVGSDPHSDLAVVRIGASALAAAELAWRREVRRSQELILSRLHELLGPDPVRKIKVVARLSEAASLPFGDTGDSASRDRG